MEKLPKLFGWDWEELSLILVIAQTITKILSKHIVILLMAFVFIVGLISLL